MDEANILGERLLVARHRAGLTQRAFGRLLAVSTHTVGEWERGTYKSPRVHHLMKAARVLGVSLDYLVGMDLLQQ